MYGRVNDVNFNSVVERTGGVEAASQCFRADAQFRNFIVSKSQVILGICFPHREPLRQVAGKFFGTILD